MFDTLIAWLVATFLVGPMQDALQARLAEGRAPVAVVREVTTCAAEAAPALLARAGADPWWLVTTVVGGWTGQVKPEALLLDAAPACGSALNAARPYMG